MKVVKKPWGEENWVEQNDRYCFKIIKINSGFKTSLQYHEFKLETIYIVSGKARIYLDGKIFEEGAGFYFTVNPGIRHRVEAIEDLVFHEMSTHEVDDLIRVEDEYHRV